MGNRQVGFAGCARLAVVVALLATALSVSSAAVRVDDEPYPLLFPVAEPNSWSDTWGAARSEGRTHKGTDIFAEKGTPVLAAADGVVTRIAQGERAGRYIVVRHDDGWSSYYMHLDNDSPGTDDGQGGEPAEGIVVGARVQAGDVLDFVGDSGNAETTSPHLHFELHMPDGTAINPAPHLEYAVTGTFTPAAIAQTEDVEVIRYDAMGTELVGHVDPGGGFAAGLAVHEGFAYMGTWGRPDSCPNSGVRVIDATDPADPVVVATLAGADEFPETSADGVWVGALASASFTGDLAIVGVRLCDTSERNRRSDDFRGLVFYDVTDPAEPLVLGSLHSGEMTQGPNDVTAAVAEDGTLLVSATVMQSYLHTEEAAGDWRLVDGTDPADPIELAHWDFRGALDEGSEARASTDYHAHTTTFSSGAESIWIGIWDGGVAMLDLTDRASPTMAAHVPVADGEEGNAHSVVFDAATGLLIRNDEDLEWRDETPSAWGGQTLYDASDLSAVTQVGTFATDRSDLSTGVPAAPGYFSAHEIVLVNDIAYVSWFSDGLRIVDVSEPGQPEEVAHFVPAPTADPQHHFLGQGRGSEFAMVWSVKVADGLLYLSDMNSGLWIVRVAAAATANTTSAS